jgi:peroxiredoxin
VGLTLGACATLPPAAVPGSAVPTLSFALADGSELSTEKARGDVVVLTFFTIWCPASAGALRAVEEVRLANKGAAGLTMLAVNEGDKADDVSAFIAKQGIKMGLTSDRDGSIASKIGLPTMPSVVVVDRSGVIRHVFAGYHGEADRAAIGAAVTAVLAEGSDARSDSQ